MQVAVPSLQFGSPARMAPSRRLLRLLSRWSFRRAYGSDCADCVWARGPSLRRRRYESCRAGSLPDDARLNDLCVGGTNSALVERRAIFGRKAARLNDVFCCKRNAGQLAFTGGFLREDLDPRMYGRVFGFDALRTSVYSGLAGLAVSAKPVAECFKSCCRLNWHCCA